MPETRDSDLSPKPDGGPVKILYVVTEDWYFVSHRLALAQACRDAGCDVAVATRVGECRDEIEAAGIRVIPIRLRRSGRNPLRELAAIFELRRILRRERPHIAHLVAMKPVVYGALAALAGRPPVVIGALAGLGHTFISKSPKALLLRGWIRAVLRLCLHRRGSWLILQNDADVRAFAEQRIVAPGRIALIRGSGVDPRKFSPSPEPAGAIVAAVVSRMLADKGIRETVRAARELRRRGSGVRILLVGDPDPENPSSIPVATLRAWHDEGCIEWRRATKDVPAVWAEAQIAVLPSYREGLPKALIEAAACGRPIVTTDVPGCRDVVQDGETGRLVPPRDAVALADAIADLAAAPETRARMGRAGRERVEQLYTVEQVIAETLALYERSLAEHGVTFRHPARSPRAA